MRYPSNGDLPAPVRDRLPTAAQDIYRTTFNNAWDNRAKNPIEEAAAHALAWDAVAKAFVHEGGEWIPRGVPG
ncbi:cation transporter [Hyphomicrobium methylovorum]|uniref:ChaB family protein n=1 Tax=Hyphomicrobium methylovorum TaxID=84 RepID=UPI0015E6B112|nr:ChaB family protein [Hyphomicrobium methylovorum]MBA2125434.1 cation transporter [Hyphomicrobium methylovorum]